MSSTKCASRAPLCIEHVLGDVMDRSRDQDTSETNTLECHQNYGASMGNKNIQEHESENMDNLSGLRALFQPTPGRLFIFIATTEKNVEGVLRCLPQHLSSANHCSKDRFVRPLNIPSRSKSRLQDSLKPWVRFTRVLASFGPRGTPSSVKFSLEPRQKIRLGVRMVECHFGI